MTAIKKTIFTAMLFVLLGTPGFSQAAEEGVLSEHYTQRVPARLAYGFMNTVFGWTALGIAPYQAGQEGAGAGDAFGRAITHPFAHTFLGIWDLVTFWVPGELGRSMAVPRHVWMAREKLSESTIAVPQEPEPHDMAAPALPTS